MVKKLSIFIHRCYDESHHRKHKCPKEHQSHCKQIINVNSPLLRKMKVHDRTVPPHSEKQCDE
jgi:hypothetical protein